MRSIHSALAVSLHFATHPVMALLAVLGLGACQVQEKGSATPLVTTENPDYNRLRSHVLVRKVKVPTEAALDYAAYAKNVMLADPEWHAVRPNVKVGMDDLKFGGIVVETKAILDFTPLTEAEQSRPMAWTPVLDRLLSWDFAKTSPLANAYAGVTAEKWGDTSDVSLPFQEFGALYLHVDGNVREAWVEVEFKPWLGSALEGIQDRDSDKFPEVFARIDPALFTAEMANFLLGDYATKALAEPEVLDWARNLASRWYPSYNTDIVETRPGEPWPYGDVTAKARADLGGYASRSPLVIFRGRPFEDTLYNVFEVEGMGPSKTAEARRREGVPVKRGVDKGLGARLDAIAAKVDGEVKAQGGSWEAWVKKLGPFREQVSSFAAREPSAVQGLVGRDGWLVFRRELDYLTAPDWASPEARHHPLPVIAALKDRLAAQGIDFLFVPIPTKLDVYPEMLDAPGAPAGSAAQVAIPGGAPQPMLRKVIRDLAEARVETVDLLPAFLAIKGASEAGKRTLYQKQDTHWSTVGLESAAQVLAERIRNYSWFDSAFPGGRDYRFHDTAFVSLGDIQARLSDAAKAKVGPEPLLGRQVLSPDGNLYQDDASSPVLVLGDSYTGIYHSVGCGNAGVTAHLAARLGGPVDLIMGWGGGPEAPQKLARRGNDYLAGKRLVVWMMSARDLFAYPGDWAGDKAAK